MHCYLWGSAAWFQQLFCKISSPIFSPPSQSSIDLPFCPLDTSHWCSYVGKISTCRRFWVQFQRTSRGRTWRWRTPRGGCRPRRTLQGFESVSPGAVGLRLALLSSPFLLSGGNRWQFQLERKKTIKGYLLIECYYLHLTDMSLEKGEEERQMFQTFRTTSLQKLTFREGRLTVTGPFPCLLRNAYPLSCVLCNSTPMEERRK